ncbi:MAG: hypothetical protein KAU62_15965 [Candidatus Heimdallarchaeota archaeon]|nr:hypothetical protein [Candidatus Heimdallarchaeota archaeon]MCK4612653.1 hypothetical protein [Candidatus Heimdallarchaeota archaeon]
MKTLDPCSITNLKENGITFIVDSKYIDVFRKNVKESNIGNLVVVTTREIKNEIGLDFLEYIYDDNPKLKFAQIVNETIAKPDYKIHSTAYIEKGVKIGNNVTIHPFSVIYRDTEIGDNSIIHANCVIGGIGFGFVKSDETWLQFPQIGSVKIGENVEIGASTIIDKGALDQTVIQDGTKIDKFVTVGHGTQIGKNCIITAGVIISGSVKIGNNVWIAPNVSIREGIVIGDNSFIGIGAIIIKDVESNVKIIPNLRNIELPK